MENLPRVGLAAAGHEFGGAEDVALRRHDRTGDLTRALAGRRGVVGEPRVAEYGADVRGGIAADADDVEERAHACHCRRDHVGRHHIVGDHEADAAGVAVPDQGQAGLHGGHVGHDHVLHQFAEAGGDRRLELRRDFEGIGHRAVVRDQVVARCQDQPRAFAVLGAGRVQFLQ